ncbi:adenosylcobinamide amidohydrolase [Streptomyces sp. NBC_01260]|uniref:adenosylcobinamide amidohydrolase n=1 Tax=unclassified Streptomyces TaxID=2593676 RepID=UPI000F485E4C|nr:MULTISPECIES: adenosylcobinamide amidohydrolase [unclassified Streptomyces]MCX4774654.1 adenosylcobinamide amidohydrolase [Streptomyces sp. NBC_01285]ROQ72816.1 adenosylcobinamide amidohydrolase [Streptomyces sp. CEV 2-1]RPK34994.1 Adenosylcobinamide amidohydrolase [Streptomyces sp. ADI92-24]
MIYGSAGRPPSCHATEGCPIRSVRVRLPEQRGELLARHEDGVDLHHLVWRLGPGWRVCSSAVLGGGIGPRDWILNAQVPGGYPRMDPDRHLAEIAAAEHLSGPGAGLMTAADVTAYTVAADEGVTATATCGLGVRGWAAAPAEDAGAPPRPGTVNIVVILPAPLSDAALVNAVATATEAKVQALLDAGLDCSGTPTDSVCIAAPAPEAGPGEPFAGPRSLWGARLARAVHAAVLEGALP